MTASSVLNPAQPASLPATGTLLFVDDEPSILSALRRLFRPLGHRVLMAESGSAALEILAQEDVDLVLSDMRMPGMDGAQLLAAVRERHPEIARLLLTGYADIGSTIAAINLGEIQRYIPKPWDDQELLLAVREGLERRRLERENEALHQRVAEQNMQLQTANAELQTVNDRLDDVNHQLERANGELEKRVASRTAELSQVNLMLGKAYEQLQTNFLLSIKVFAGLLELREGSLPGYSEKVGQLAQRLALKLGMSDIQQRDCYAAGLLCEIGKIGLPDRMLRTPFSAMRDDERQRYCRHPLLAEAALMPLNDLRNVARLVRQHQERLDGRGYPDGLTGNDVPLQAQLIGLAATYESLIAGRLGEKRYAPAEAQAAIEATVGAHYSPVLIDAFRQVMADDVAAEPPMVELDVESLKPGMVMGRDLTSPRGTLLLSKGYRFDAVVIKTLCDLVQRERLDIRFFIRTDLAPAI
ncbi:HD domain-containing phosphohydrolase [Roseateles cellulosilyticus]|uniref:Response regulator n=1 Tax=Pelomonas cellulosilytica TaxID=2906762 RepID=A0ABS8XQ98_9BURK|nr:HD domain-containing phosphohydrolase [Pelomonas sp. P8]MCE4554003.1 response regulator [Pelomonas sp. P8]